jgi:catechol 2,3-dioxygenase-like lactoylglutathione lyase family enzyme
VTTSIELLVTLGTEGSVIKTMGLTHIHLEVRDVERSVDFYRSVFGMEERFREGRMVFLRTPGAQDTVTLSESPDRGDVRGGVDHFGFRLVDKSDLDQAIAEVQGAGGRLLDRGRHAPGKPYAYVADPDGYVIEL